MKAKNLFINGCLGLLFVMVSLFKVQAQSSFLVDGYITNMQSIIALSGEQITGFTGVAIGELDGLLGEDSEKYWLADNLIHNRLNFNWYATDFLTFKMDVRNRFMYGDQMTLDFGGTAKDAFSNDKGWSDLSFNVLKGNSFLWNIMIDRLYADVNVGKLNVTVGRQRINWGQGFVWNPNDVFNVYSYFDFDYVERPGSDAIRLQYYTSYTSKLEVAAKIDYEDRWTFAVLSKNNIGKYDVQILGGLLEERDWFGGLGWAGSIGSIGFTGEASYFYPKESFKDTSGILLTSIGLNYTFSNSLMVQAEFLYNQQPEGQPTQSFWSMYGGNMNVKNSSISETNFFVSASYPISPLVSATVSGMYMSDLKGWYFGPSVSISVSDNIDFSTFFQYFEGEISEFESEQFLLGFLRLKWSF